MGWTLVRHGRLRWFIPVAPVVAVVGAVCSGLTGQVEVGFLIAAASVVGVIGGAVGGVLGVFIGIVVVFFGIMVSFAIVSPAGFNISIGVGNIVGVVGGVATIAALLLGLSILVNSRQGYRMVFAHPLFNTAIDILGVMLAALFIASLFANPPIW